MSSIFGLVHILAMVAIQFLLISSVSPLNITNAYLHHKCNNTAGKYKPGSAFEKNLNKVLRGKAQNIEAYSRGFLYPSEGEDPDLARVMYQCRGDSYGSKCRSCVTAAISELRRRCSGNKEAVIWYDQCLFVISSFDTYNKIDYENNFYLSNANNVSGDPKLFNKEVLTLLANLRYRATDSEKQLNNAVLYAVGEKRIGTEKIYAMVQCTKDLVHNSCSVCLEWILKKFPECCDGKRGGRFLTTSCNFRFEFYPFL